MEFCSISMRNCTVSLPNPVYESLASFALRVGVRKMDLIRYIIAYWFDHPELHDSFAEAIENVQPTE